jgi:hypothetical protein
MKLMDMLLAKIRARQTLGVFRKYSRQPHFGIGSMTPAGEGLHREHRQTAREYLEASEFPRLVDSLLAPVQRLSATVSCAIGSSGPHESQSEYIHIDLRLVNSKKSWSLWKYSIFRTIEIECTPSGTIIVRGGLFGSTTLPLYRWMGRPDLQEQALQKAYRHPSLAISRYD